MKFGVNTVSFPFCQRHDYTSGQTDTWDILEAADENPNNSTQILALYPNIAYTKFGGGTGPYNPACRPGAGRRGRAGVRAG